MDTTQARGTGWGGGGRAIKINIKKLFVSVGNPKKISATNAKVYRSIELNAMFPYSH